MKLWSRSHRAAAGARPPGTPSLSTGSHARIGAAPGLRPFQAKAVRALEQARPRLAFASLSVAIAFTGICGGLLKAMVIDQVAEPAMARAGSGTALHTGRGDIVDRNGTLLATNLVTYSLYADPKLIIDPIEAAEKLTAALPDLDYADVISKLGDDKRFVWIRRNMSPRDQAAIHRLGIPGVYFQREERRLYTHGNLAAHAVGFTDVDGKGLMGIERQFDGSLRGAVEPLQLSLDIRLQHILRKELQASVAEFQAIGAGGMILDVRSGEVLAMVSLPDFNPHNPTGLDENTRFNRNTLGVYEMGSTFKIFNSALAFESGKIRLGDVFETSPIRIGRHTISDYHPENRPLNVAEIFMHSSNLGSVRMLQKVGTTAQREFMGKLGLLDMSPVEIPEKGKPLVPKPWREINGMTISFGHGLSVSPMQLASAAAATINGGLLYPPTLLKHAADAPADGQRVLTEQTSALMRRMFRLVVEKGTAKGAAAPGYAVGGKTGTAEKLTGRTYNRKARMSSFVGAFPMNDPRYLVLAIIDEPKGNKRTYGYATGGWVAAPVVGAVVRQMGPLYGIKPINEEDPALVQAIGMPVSTR